MEIESWVCGARTSDGYRAQAILYGCRLTLSS